MMLVSSLFYSMFAGNMIFEQTIRTKRAFKKCSSLPGNSK